MVIPVALVAAICFGSADFFGGIAARRAGPLAATAVINLVALALLAVPVAIAFPGIDAGHLAAAICGGVLSAVTLGLIFAAFAAGAMSLAAPLVACGSVSVPTLTAIATGEAPSALQGVGILMALAAVLTITWPGRGGSAAGSRLGRRALVLAGLAALCSGSTLALLQLSVGEDGGAAAALGASGISRAAAVAACLLALLVVRPAGARQRDLRPPAAAAGVLEAAGATLFLLATSLGNSAVVAVLVSLYAIATVALAQLILREHLSRAQALGIAIAAAGVALMSAG